MVSINLQHNGAKTPCGLCCTKIENFSVTYGKKNILQDVNLHIHCGELTALIGPNGAGKTTLLKAILGEIPHDGELRFLDANGLHTNHPVIGYVPQRLAFDPGSPVSVLDLFAAARSKVPVWLGQSRIFKKETQKKLNRVQAGHLLDHRLGALSGGELQKVLLALALDPLPDLLLLDEPISGVDQKGRGTFYNLVSDLRHQYDLSIILVSHDFRLLSQYADRVVFLNRTVQCSGSPAEVFSSEKITQAFGLLNWEAQSHQDTDLRPKGGRQ